MEGGGNLEEEELRAGEPVAGATAAEGGLHPHLHSALHLTALHLGQAVVVVLKGSLVFDDRLVVLQSQCFIFTFPAKETLQPHKAQVSKLVIVSTCHAAALFDCCLPNKL